MKYLQMIEPGKSLGVVGIGGLGHMALKLGKAFGLQVTVISPSPKKEKEAREFLGAGHFIINKYQRQMEDAAKSLHYILDTVFVEHPLQPFISFLKVQRKLVLVGLPENPVYFHPAAVIAGSLEKLGFQQVLETWDLQLENALRYASARFMEVKTIP